MKIKIIETGKEVELNIIDPKSGCDWVSDLMGNHNELPAIEEDEDGYDTGFHLMTQEGFDWWKDLTVSLEKAEDRLYRLDYNEDEKNDTIGNCDLEDLPNYINQFCDEVEAVRPTLETLNANNKPEKFNGELLGSDGHGNELWLFRAIDKVANLHTSEEGQLEWSADVEGWNYTSDSALK